MPIYEYVCESCKTKFEKLVRTMGGTQEIECPKCGSKKASRQFSSFAVGAGGAEAGHSHGAGCGCCSAAPSCPNARF